MKYDSGMTHFKKDIIVAIKHMLKNDTEITNKFKAEDGSPAPLREYLKASYGKAYRSHCGDGIRYVCHPTKGIGIMFDNILNNLRDTELTLSWSQVVKFIRDNWEEIFMDKPTYREALKQQFPQLTDEMINRFTCCPGHFFYGDSIPFAATCNYEGSESLCLACWDKPCEGTYNGDPFDPSDWEDELSGNQQVAPEEKQLPAEQTDDSPADTAEVIVNATDVKLGDFITENMLGEQLTFDELAEMCGELVVDDMSTESRNWFKVVLIDKVVTDNDGSRRLVYYDDPKKKSKDTCSVGEYAFKSSGTRTLGGKTVSCAHRMWRIKREIPDKALPEAAGKISETFNYAVLSTELGDFLKRKEQQLKNEYMNFTVNCGAIFAEAQEKLAGSNQYNGLFEKWIVSMGFSKKTVYRMIDVHKFCSCQIDTSKQAEIFDGLPKMLQYDVSAKSAPPELVEQVMNGDITTHKEYIALKKQLEDEKFRADHLQGKLNEKSEKISTLNDKNSGLEKRIKELESRPIDVAVQTDEAEIERRAAEYTQSLICSKEAEFDQRLREMQSENRRLKKEISEAGRTELDDCFNNSTSADEEMLSDIYETLHGKVLSALGDCAYFIQKDGLPESVKSKAVSRFESISETLENYIDELEEN